MDFEAFWNGQPLHYMGSDGVEYVATVEPVKGFEGWKRTVITRADGERVVVRYCAGDKSFPAGFVVGHGEHTARMQFDEGVKHPPIPAEAITATLSDELDVTPIRELTPAKPQVVRAVSRVIGNLQYGSLQEDRFVVGRGCDFEWCEGDKARWYAQREGRTSAYGAGYATRDEAIAHVDRLIAAERVPAPIAAIETDAPLSGESKPKRTAAHIRAIMAYLAMRKERDDALGQLQRTVTKRRRAITAARVRSQAAWQLGKALVANMQEAERLKRVSYQQAGHIINLGERIDKAEQLLRSNGYWPDITVTAPDVIRMGAMQ